MTGHSRARVPRVGGFRGTRREGGSSSHPDAGRRCGVRRGQRGGRRCPPPVQQCCLSGVPVPTRLPRRASAAGRRGRPKTMARGRGSGAPPRPGRGAPRGGAAAKERPGTPPPAAGRAPGARRSGTEASAHLDEELDDGFFVLLLQPVQRHRQRHGRFGWTLRSAAAASAPGLL